MFCLVPLYWGWQKKHFKATPTRQDLGTSSGFFKHTHPFNMGSHSSPLPCLEVWNTHTVIAWQGRGEKIKDDFRFRLVFLVQRTKHIFGSKRYHIKVVSRWCFKSRSPVSSRKVSKFWINLQVKAVEQENYGVCGVYSQEPRPEVYCFKLHLDYWR